MTGRYQDLVGVPGVIRTHAANSWGYLRHDAVLLPSAMAKAGYCDLKEFQKVGLAVGS